MIVFIIGREVPVVTLDLSAPHILLPEIDIRIAVLRFVEALVI
jgi:hypothetical protein